MGIRILEQDLAELKFRTLENQLRAYLEILGCQDTGHIFFFYFKENLTKNFHFLQNVISN